MSFGFISLRKSMVLRFLLLVILCIMNSTPGLLAQEKFHLGIQGDLFIFPVSRSAFITSHSASIEMKGDALRKEALYAEFWYWPLRDFGIQAGIGYHTFSYEASYRIPLDFEGHTTVLRDMYVLRIRQWIPGAGIAYRHNKLMASVHLAAEGPMQVTSSGIRENGSVTNLYIVSQLAGSGYRLREEFPDENGRKFVLLQTRLRYEIARNLRLTAGLESTVFGGGLDPFTVSVYSTDESSPPVETLLKELTLYTRYTAVTLGLGYHLGFGKYRPRQ